MQIKDKELNFLQRKRKPTFMQHPHIIDGYAHFESWIIIRSPTPSVLRHTKPHAKASLNARGRVIFTSSSRTTIQWRRKFNCHWGCQE